MANHDNDDVRKDSGAMLTRAHQLNGGKSSMYTRTVFGCLYVACATCAGLIVMVITMYSLHWGHGDPTGAILAVFAQLLIFAGMIFGFHRRHRWAWYAALLAFVIYGLGMLFFLCVGVRGMLIFLPWSIIGIRCLVADACREEFGLKRS
jgi:hypothetical protein